MNETGSWPGQPWLWLYAMWHQVGPMKTSGNGDVEVIAIMAVCSIGLLFVPFIPGRRDIPRAVPIHRLIWKDYYRNQPRGTSGATTPAPPTAPLRASSVAGDAAPTFDRPPAAPPGPEPGDAPS